MATYKTSGIILKSIKLGEADKIITIYSDSHGKISAVAKGIRRTKSKFGSRLEPFTYARLLLFKGRSLDIITQVEIASSFKEIREDFDMVSYGWAMLDLVNKVSLEGEKDSKLFYLLLKSLETLAKVSSSYDLILAAFDLKLLALIGYRPNLLSCAVCRRKPTQHDKFLFSSECGGVLCDKCGSSDPSAILSTFESISLLRQLMLSELESVAKVEVSQELKDKVANLISKYLDYHVQANLKSRRYLAKVNTNQT